MADTTDTTVVAAKPAQKRARKPKVTTSANGTSKNEPDLRSLLVQSREQTMELHRVLLETLDGLGCPANGNGKPEEDWQGAPLLAIAGYTDAELDACRKLAKRLATTLGV